MDKIRAEILDTGSSVVTSARIEISAPAQEIFDLIADPRCHHLFDGSGTVPYTQPTLPTKREGSISVVAGYLKKKNKTKSH